MVCIMLGETHTVAYYPSFAISLANTGIPVGPICKFILFDTYTGPLLFTYR